ncbi:hypothetical protein A2U01_0071224, partial [Trifolium medium]|nr:hypothetical protein [Trifolium medium]
MLMSAEIQELQQYVIIVRSRVIMPEIAVLQKRRRMGMQHKELDPPPKDVYTAWAQ